MTSLDVLRRLHQHRIWANHRLLDAAGTLPATALHAEHSIGQGSIWRSLMHMYAAEWVWLETLNGDESPLLPGDRPDGLPGNQAAAGGIASFEELRTAWAALDTRWTAYFETLANSQLEDIVYKVSSLQKTRMGCRRVDILLHVCTHAHYTVAQTINMLRQVGAESLPDPMLITMARQEVSRPAS